MREWPSHTVAATMFSVTFNVRARLTNDAIELANQGLWMENPDLKALTALCRSDPVITADRESYVLSSSELDGVDTTDLDRQFAVAELVLQRVNGTAQLMLTHYLCPARLTGHVQSSARSGARAHANGVVVYPPDRNFAALDPGSAATILTSAAADPLLDQVLKLLGDPRPGFLWIDLWRMWDVLRRRAEINGIDRRQWVGDDQACLDFERSANDPAVSGTNARHGYYQTRPNATDKRTGLPLGQPMSPRDATAFIHALIRRWIEEDTGHQLVLEVP